MVAQRARDLLSLIIIVACPNLVGNLNIKSTDNNKKIEVE